MERRGLKLIAARFSNLKIDHLFYVAKLLCIMYNNTKKNIILWKDIACAVYAKYDAFITTDKGILKKKIDDIKVLNPIDFMREVINNDV